MIAMRRQIACLISGLLAISFGHASERPQLYGLALAYPKSVPQFSTRVRKPRLSHELQVLMVLEIDRTGLVSSIQPEDQGDSSFVDYVRAYLTSIEFEPAVFRSDKVASRLPVLTRFIPRSVTPDFFFPVNSDLSIDDQDLYAKAITVNDIEPPRLVSFPSFHGDVKVTDTMTVYPIVLLRIALDEAGRPVEIADDLSTYSPFDRQIRSAVLYAEFSPARVKGQAVSSEAYLLVSFFPQISYPTRPWLRSKYDEMRLVDKNQVRLIPAKVGLLCKPIIRRVPADRYPRGAVPFRYRETISVYIEVDTLGRVSLLRTSRAGKDILASVKYLVKKFKFFPALDYQGKPRSFRGVMLLEFVSEENIRMHYLWSEIRPSY